MAGTIKGITIQLGADTTKLSDALNKANKSIKSCQTELRGLDKALKFDPGNAALLGDKMTLLKEKTEQAKQKVDALKQAQAQMDAAGVDKNSQEYQKLQREIDLAEAEVKQLEAETRNFGSVGAQQIAAVGSRFQQIGSGLSGVGRTLTTYVTTPILGIGAATIKTAGEFEQSMSNVQAISGATAGDMDKLKDKARELGSQTKFSASEVGDAMSYMAMAGWKPQQMLDGLKGVLDLATASGEDLAKTSDIVTDGLTAFGLSAKDSSQFADVLAAASSNANTNVSMMGESFKYVAPVAGSMGYSVQDVSVALGLMANSGIKASSAGTSLRTLLTNMANPTDTMKAAMDRLNISLDDGQGHMYSFREILDNLRAGFGNIKMPVDEYQERLSELEAMYLSGEISESKYSKKLEELTFQAYGAEGAQKAQAAAMLAGKTGMAGLLAIVSAAPEDYEKLCAAIDGASEAYVKCTDGSVMPMTQALEEGKDWVEEYSGAAEAMAAVMRDNLFGQLTELKSALQEAAIAIGNQFLPQIKKAVAAIQGWVADFNKLDDSQKKHIATIALVVAAIGPLLLVLGKTMETVGRVMKYAPQIQAGLTVVKTAITAATSSVGGFSGALSLIASPAGIAVAAIVGIGAAVATLWKKNEDFRNKITAMWNSVSEKFQSACQRITDVINSFGFDFSGVVDAIKGAWEGLCNLLAPVFEGVFRTITATIEGLIDIVTGVVEVIGGVIHGFADGDWTMAWQGICDIAVGIFNKLTAPIQGVLQAICSAFGVDFEKIKNVVSTVFGFVRDHPKEALNVLKQTVSTVLEAVKGFFQSKLDGIKSTVSNVMNAVKQFFSTALDTIKNKASTILEAVRNFFQTKLEAAKSVAQNALNAIKQTFQTVLEAVKSKVSTILEAIKNFFQTKLQAAKSIVDSALKAIQKTFETVLNAIKNKVSTILEAIKNFFQTKLQAIKSIVDNALNAIKQAFETKLNDIKNKVSNVLESINSTFKSKLDAVKNTVSSAFTAIFNTAKSKLDDLLNKVKGVIDSIKSLFNINLKLDIKLPHISVEGGEAPYGIGGKGKLPKFNVEWYDKGGIFSSPTIIGVGEKRPEFVGALDDLRAIVREESGGGALMQEMVRLMTIMVEQGGRPITVNQEIYAESTSYAEQQKQAAREFRNIARALA